MAYWTKGAWSSDRHRFDGDAADAVLLAARDFTDRRSDVFRAAEAGHFQVHSVADDCADVTEGTGTGIGTNWERCRYDCSNPGSVTATVTDSNVYPPGAAGPSRPSPPPKGPG